MHQIDYNLSLEEIAKIEGDAGLDVTVREGKVTDVQFKIQEYKRFYTQGMRGKKAENVPQFVSRICGTCSNAHLLASIEAAEKALDIEVSEQTQLLKKLMINGLIIRDHALHLYVFALPDIFNVDSLVDFDENDPDQHQYLHDALDVKSAGNNLQIYIAGRSVHAPFAAVGGFTKIPGESPQKYIDSLKEIRPAILRLIAVFMAGQNSFESPTTYAAIRGKEWSFLEGEILFSDNKRIPESKFREHLERVVIPYSQASGYSYQGKSYMIGALARLNLNKDQLHPNTKRDAKTALEKFPTADVFYNNVAQAIEMLHCVDESIELLESATWKQENRQKPKRQTGVGVGVIEAPRGLLFYELDVQDGIVEGGEVVIPTGQNQMNIEKDIGKLVQRYVNKDKDWLTFEIEKLIRAYDPCMSCAAHFLKVNWDVE